MNRTADISRIRQLIWVYFWLLLFEGTLRKWVFQGAIANALLVVRDPIVLAAYFFAWKSGLFPRNLFMIFGGLLALITLVVGCITPDNLLPVAIYGARTNFFHLPLIFLIPKVFEAKHVQRIGYWTLLISLPMTILMVVQFASPPGSWINSAIEGYTQIRSAVGRIRPSGTFTFISGPIYFYALVAAFLLHSQFVPKRYPLWLCVAASLSFLVTIAVSGSRSLLVSVVIVCAFAFLNPVLRLQVKSRWVFAFIGLVLTVFLLIKLPVVQQGVMVFATRIAEANSSQYETEAGGFISRALGNFTSVVPFFFEAPALGYGLGMGTNVGAALLTGKAQFLLAENDWERHVLESGPLLGGALVFYRIILTFWIGSIVGRYAKQRDPLPFLLFGVCFLGLLNGQWSQGTILGFAIFVSGLCLAATRVVPQPSQPQTGRARRVTAPAPLAPRS